MRMVTYLKMAWRNLWRNKRRTFITISSVYFAVTTALYMRSMQVGSYEKMINNVVQMSTGMLQIHKDGFWNDQTIDKSFELTTELRNKLDNDKYISEYTGRISNFALVSYELQTKGVGVIGIETEKENRITKLKSKLIKGSYLKPNDTGILVPEGLADYLKVDVNDTLVLMGQGYQGNRAEGLFRVKGILKFPIPDLNNNLVYVSLPASQEFYSAENLISSVVVNLNDNDKLNGIVSKLKSTLDSEKYEVMPWQDMSKELVQMIEADNAQGIIMLIVLYLVIAFGIFGTVLMMVAERRREFGVIIAVGMKKLQVISVLIYEVLIVAFLGVLAGAITNIPFIWYLKQNPPPLSKEMAEAVEAYGMEPVISFALEVGFFIDQAVSIFIIVLIASLYPLLKVYRMKVHEALRA